jgi:hypothetical protein
MKETTVFVTYNPENDFEQTLAVRLNTIGAVHGFNMLIPDRFNNEKVNLETRHRIKSANYFILFSTSKLTSTVQEEIKIAFNSLKDKSKILIIYNKVKNLKYNQNCTEVFIDAKKDSPQKILNEVIERIKNNSNSVPSKKDNTVETLGGILLVGLGLLALNSILESKR